MYQASTFGRIKKLKRVKVNIIGHSKLFKERIVVQTMNPWGYVYVELDNINSQKYKRFAHVLTAKSFIPNPDNKSDVNHIKGIKHDNRVHQLEWNTKSENHKHAYKIGLKKVNKTALGKKYCLSPHSKPIIQYSQTGEFLKLWSSQTEAADVLGLSQGNIYSVLNNKKGYSHTGGFVFKYVKK